MNSVSVEISGKKYLYEQGTSLLEIARDFKDQFQNDIIIAEFNGRITELNYKLKHDGTLKFYDKTSQIGNLVYENGLVFLLIDSFKKILKMDVVIKHSIDKGILFQTTKKISVDDLFKVESNMKESVINNTYIEKKLINRLEAINYYKNKKEFDKVDILKYSTNTNINLYKLNNSYDYFFSYLPISTGFLKKFNLTYIDSNNFVLGYPNLYTNKMLKYKHHEKLFNEFQKYSDWTKRIGTTNISQINQKISNGDYKDLIYLNEAFQNNNLNKIAEQIFENKNVRIVLLSGPSSSGKTTTSKKLKLLLKNYGLEALSISIDDFFLDKENTPLNEDGEHDFESIRAVDTNLFNKALKKLLAGEKVKLPKYNFIKGIKEFETTFTKLLPNQIIIIEGLHALNEELTSEIEKKYKYKIYVSPLTVLGIDNHNRVRTTDTRLLRRIVRDQRTRGYSTSDTLDAWKKVRKSEEVNIFSYQDSADVIFNTSFIYELNVLKSYVEPLLYSVDETDRNYKEAVRLLNILKNVLPMPSEDITGDSVIREFIGNSYFE